MNTAWSKPTKYVVGVSLALLGIYILYLSRPVIPLLIVAALIAVIVRPIILWLHLRVHLPRGLAATVVAAAAATDNAVGMAGMCWSCRVMVVKVMQASGVANYSDIAAGVKYAADKGAKVINISLGGYSASNALHEAPSSMRSRRGLWWWRGQATTT
jgi:hypothetical protein